MSRSNPSPAALVLALTAALALAGCDASVQPAPGNDARHTQTFMSAPEGRIDVRFQPLAWASGEEIAIQAGGARVVSTASPSGRHTLTWSAASGAAGRVLGLLDGHVQASTEPGSPNLGEGETAQGPTSFHRHTVCQGATCTDVIEYDYDLTAPDGEGTTVWARPGHPSVIIDRVRFEVAAQADAAQQHSSSVTVSSPEPLRLAHQ